MKSFVIYPKEISELPLLRQKQTFTTANTKIHVGIIEEDDLTLENCPDPEYAVLVKKTAFSCNYRDKSILLDFDKKIKEKANNGDFHYSYFGSEFVGEVIDVGSKVITFKIGDRVIPNIAYPSYSKYYSPGIPSNFSSSRIEDFDENKLIKIPNDCNLPNEMLAAFPIAGFTAYSMIRKVVRPNTKVLVTASGSNTSLAVISALSKQPVEVFAMTSNPRIESKLLDLGVSKVLLVNHKLDDYMDDRDFAANMDKIQGFDTIIDPFFDVYLPKVINLLKMDGKYVTCGLHNQFSDFGDDKHVYKGIEFNKLMIRAMINNITIVGNCIGLLDDGNRALNDLINGNFKVVLDSVYSEGQESEFLERTFNSKDRFGKVIFKY